MNGQLALDIGWPEADPGQRAADIAVIHRATGIYTVPPEIEALLDRLRWPMAGKRLLDPGAGNGGFLVAALRRLELARDDVATAVRRVKGYEFYPEAVAEARWAVHDHLTGRGWSDRAAWQAARKIVEERDFLLGPVPAGVFDTIAANPPYWRLANLPPGYRAEYELIVEQHARADMLYAYLQRSADVLAAGGRIGLIAADRWLLNSGSAELRRRLGARFRVSDVLRLDSASVFYRPKDRRRGTPARVHPVSLILTPDGPGRKLSRAPFHLADLPRVEGVPLPSIARIQLAPWLGPEGVFVVGAGTSLPREHLVPAIDTDDIKDGAVQPARRWAIVTGGDEPCPEILAHLDAHLHLMPARGRRRDKRWLPPERFTGRRPLPLPHDAVLVPRIAKRLTAIRLPAGVLPVNHNLVVVSGLPAEVIIGMLEDPLVQAQADALALRLENGYESITATLLRQLIIPSSHMTARGMRG